MKTLFLISLSLIFYFQTMAKTETQKYETIYSEGNFEIRFYPVATMATVNMSGDYDNMKNAGFRVLAGYIFGANKQNEKIAMTSPVRISNQGESSSMSFVMPSKHELDNLPTPNTNKIVLHQSKAKYVASIKFGGYASSDKIEQKEKALSKFVEKFELEHNNSFEYLGYNPPYQLINRKNEVVVELVNFNPAKFK